MLEQQRDDELAKLLREEGKIKLIQLPIPESKGTTACDSNTPIIRPYVPRDLR